jgi:hypothetical protein
LRSVLGSNSSSEVFVQFMDPDPKQRGPKSSQSRTPPSALHNLVALSDLSKAIEVYRLIQPHRPIRRYSKPTLFYSPHSHSMVPGGLLVTS